jgi:hypothetical protein
LKLKRSTEHSVSRKYECDGRLSERGEAEEVTAIDRPEGPGQEGRQDGGGDLKNVEVKFGFWGDNTVKNSKKTSKEASNWKVDPTCFKS